MNKPVCRVCGGPVMYGSLYCSIQHDAQREDKHRDHIKALLASGFEQRTDRPNVFVRDGVSVTLERTFNVGLDKAIVQHGYAVDAHGTLRVAEAQPAATEAAN